MAVPASRWRTRCSASGWATMSAHSCESQSLNLRPDRPSGMWGSHPQMNVWCAAPLKFQLPNVAGRFAPFASESFAPQHHVPFHARPIRGDGFPIAGVGQGHHRRHAAALDERSVVELGEGSAHRGTGLAGPLGDFTTWRVGHVTLRLNTVHFNRYVEPMTVDGPLGCLFRANGIRPAEADHSGATVIRNRPDSGSAPSRSRPCAHG